MPQTPDEMLSAMSESPAMRTGRSLEQWLALVRSSGVDPPDQSAVRNWLRREHGVPQNSQWAIADAAAPISTTVTREAEKHRAMFA